MKLTSVELHPGAAATMIPLSFRDPMRQNPYNVKAILGLDADEIVPRFYGRSSQDNTTTFFEMSLEKREVVIAIVLNPDYGQNQTPSDLRDALYKHISASRTGLLQLRFKNGTDTIAAISGFVKKFESPHFSISSEVQITLECEEPMLRALTETSFDVTGLNPGDFTVTDSLSTATHGMRMSVLVNANRPNIVLRSMPHIGWEFRVSPLGGFLDNDVVHISSVHNDKYVRMVRTGTITPLAHRLSASTQWPVIFPGPNRFRFLTPTGLTIQSITHFPSYWGV
jgi:hypothetical protein